MPPNPPSNDIGSIISLFISQKNLQKRVSKKSIHLDLPGILNDKYYNTNIQRSVLITSLESYRLANDKQIHMPYGSLGENILIDYNPYKLLPGTQLKTGTCLLEISQNCTMCEHLSNINKELPSLLKDDRGIFAKVIQKGVIRQGDSIYLIPTA